MHRSSNRPQSPFELAERGLFADASKAIDALPSPSISLQVLRAELDAHTASPAAAQQRAELLLAKTLPSSESAACWAVVGHAAFKAGRLHHGLRGMDRALESAMASGNAKLEYRIRDRLAFSLLNCVGAETARAGMARLRQSALRAGDIASIVSFHIFAGAVDARQGRLPSSLSNLAIGRDLLQKFDNEWLRGRLEITSGVACMLLSDYAAATKHLEQARQAALRSGSKELSIAATGNLATLMLAGRDFDHTRALLAELSAEIQRTGSVSSKLSVSDTALQLALAEGDLPGAISIDDDSAEVVSEAEPGSLHRLWYLVDKVRLSYAKGEAQAGLKVALDALPYVQRSSDIDLWRRLKLLVAEGLGRIGTPLEGAKSLREAVSGLPSCSVEITAEKFRVAGHLSAREDADAAVSYFNQAQQILQDVRNLNASEEVRRSIKETIGGRPPAVCVHEFEAEQVVTLLQTSSYTPLLARGLMSWAASRESFDWAAIEEIDA